jgi:hypothetical protein
MSKNVEHLPAEKDISYPRFAAFYTWMTNRTWVRQWEDPCNVKPLARHRGSCWCPEKRQ